MKIPMCRILLLFSVAFSAQAVIVNGSEEHSKLMLPKYVKSSELIVIGEIFREYTKQFIKVGEVLKGDLKYKGEIIPTYSIIPYITNLTCGTGQPLAIPDGEVSIVFFDYEPNISTESKSNKSTSHYRQFHIAKKFLVDVKKLFKDFAQ